MLRKERKRLHKVEPTTLVEYIQTSIEILMQIKSEEMKGSKVKEEVKTGGDFLKKQIPNHAESIGPGEPMAEPPQEYEKLIIKLEGEVRNHIKIE